MLDWDKKEQNSLPIEKQIENTEPIQDKDNRLKRTRSFENKMTAVPPS